MSEFDHEPWIADARRLLDESAQALDAATLSRLNRARHAAVARARRTNWSFGWFAAAGVACSAVLLLAVALRQPAAPEPASRPSAAPSVAAATADAPGAASVVASGTEADNDTGDDSLDFYQDLEFYAWLDAQGGDGDGDG